MATLKKNKEGLYEIKAKEMEVETQSAGKPSSPHANQAIFNSLNPLLEMLNLWSDASLMLIHVSLKTLKPWGEANLLLIHVILNTLKSLLQILKLRGEANLILIHMIIHGLEPSITNYSKFLHASA